MTKLLIINGDSWTHGAELIDPQLVNKKILTPQDSLHELNNSYRESHIWPTLIAHKLNLKLENISYSGRSTDLIVTSTIAKCLSLLENNQASDLHVIIGLTDPGRIECLLDDNGTLMNTVLFPHESPAAYSSPALKNHFKFFIVHKQSDFDVLYRFLNQLYYLHNFCKNRGIKYTLFMAFYEFTIDGRQVGIKTLIESLKNVDIGLVRHGDFSGANYIDLMQAIVSEIETNWLDIDTGSTFKNYIIRHCGSPLIGHHPSEEGHYMWAEHICDRLQMC